MFLGQIDMGDAPAGARGVQRRSPVACLVDEFQEQLRGVILHNLYGPTEASYDVTVWTVRRWANRSIPIGRPIANTQIYILDSQVEAVPVGVAGSCTSAEWEWRVGTEEGGADGGAFYGGPVCAGG